MIVIPVQLTDHLEKFKTNIKNINKKTVEK